MGQQPNKGVATELEVALANWRVSVAQAVAATIRGMVMHGAFILPALLILVISTSATLFGTSNNGEQVRHNNNDGLYIHPFLCWNTPWVTV